MSLTVIAAFVAGLLIGLTFSFRVGVSIGRAIGMVSGALLSFSTIRKVYSLRRGNKEAQTLTQQ